MQDADVILRSSDLVNFRVRRSILATSSPFFDDLFSLPQPPDHEVVDRLPVVHIPEDAQVLNSLVNMLYPVLPAIPNSVDNILTLLAACEKYDMTTVQSFIREEVNRRGLLSPTGAESFRIYAIACRKKLIPETKAAARLTLSHPMTFEFLGEALRSFEGWVLLDLYRFHQCCRNSIASCLKVFSGSRNGPSKIWVGCPGPRHLTLKPPSDEDSVDLPIWLKDVFEAEIIQTDVLMSPPATPSSIRKTYLKALRGHVIEKDCSFCMKTHALKGEEFCDDLENQLAQAWDVQYSFRIELPESKIPPPPSVCICHFSPGSLAELFDQ